MKKVIIFVLISLVLFTSCQSLDNKTITVVGTSKVELVPDIASFTVSIREKAKTTKEAQNMTNSKMNEVYSILLEEFLILEESLETEYMNLYPEYTYVDDERISYQVAEQEIKVTLFEISLISKIVDRLSEITNIRVSSINLDKKDKTNAYNIARELAFKQAEDKARLYSEQAGLSLSSAIKIVEEDSSAVSHTVYNKDMVLAESASTSSAYYSGNLEISTSVVVEFIME